MQVCLGFSTCHSAELRPQIAPSAQRFFVTARHACLVSTASRYAAFSGVRLADRPQCWNDPPSGLSASRPHRAKVRERYNIIEPLIISVWDALFPSLRRSRCRGCPLLIPSSDRKLPFVGVWRVGTHLLVLRAEDREYRSDLLISPECHLLPARCVRRGRGQPALHGCVSA